jgi:electron transport complex protein RnfC
VVCPVGLDPEELYKTAGISGAADAAGSVLVKKCHGCGCCEVVCPSRLPLSAVLANFAGETILRDARETLLHVAEIFGDRPGGEF